MKPLLLCLLAMMCFTSMVSARQDLNNRPITMPATIFLTDIQGKRTTEEWNRHEVKGTPFLISNWATSLITLADNRNFNNVSIRLNCVNNTVHYLNAKKEELVAPDGVIKEIRLQDSSSSFKREYVLVSGFPPIDKHDANTFYERQIDGRAQLLVYTRKRLLSTQTMGSAGPEKEYVGVETFFVYKNGVIREWEKGKDFMLGFFMDKQEEIAKYIDEQKLKCRTILDLKLVLAHYNSIP